MMKKKDSAISGTEAGFISRFNRLIGELLGWFCEEGSEKNIVFSPFSVFALLTLAADASEGRTKEEICWFLQTEKDFDRVKNTLADIQNSLAADQTFISANAVMVRNDKRNSITPGYADHLKEVFGGELFAAEDMIRAVNDWICKKTEGKIQKIADDSMKEMLLCLLNACTFNAEWLAEYESIDIQNEDFHNRDGSVSRVKMLSSIEPIYIENERFIGFAKPYKGEQFSYVVLMPKNDDPFSEEILASVDYPACLVGVENTEAEVLMPEFRCSSDFDISELCRENDITTIFTPYADFSPMASARLKVEKIRHKACIEVDRKGTRARAASSMYFLAGAGLDELPEAKEVIVNRPFLYAVIHHETGIPVFVGMINHLEPLGEGEDRLTNREKEALCSPVYDRICRIILDEDGIVKENIEREFWYKVHAAYLNVELDELLQLEEELKGKEM